MDEADDLTPLDPAYKSMLRLQFAIVGVVLLVAATIAEFAIPGWTGAVWIPALLVATYALVRVPLRRYNARGYSLAQERLRVVRGVIFRADTVVVRPRPAYRCRAGAAGTRLRAGYPDRPRRARTTPPYRFPACAMQMTAMREDIRAAIRRDTR